MGKKKKQPVDVGVGALKASLPTPELTAEYCHVFSKWVFDNYGADDVLMATIHGSYLYGTAHENSDLDCYVVTLHGKNTHKEYMTDNGYVLDVRRNNLERYVELVGAGAHQAVEAFYSPYAVWNTESAWHPFLQAQRTNLADFAKKCLSAADAFREQAENKPEKAKKFVTHADRLEYGVEHALDHQGAYTPVWKPLGAQMGCTATAWDDLM